MEEIPFPRHRETAMTITTELGGSGVLIEEIEEAEVTESPMTHLVQSLLTTKLFRSFFSQLDFKKEAQKEAIENLLAVAQKYGPTCHMVGHSFRKMARE